MSGLLLAAIAFLGLAVVLVSVVYLSRRTKTVPEPIRRFRLLVPRSGRFGVPEAAAWFRSLAPLLPASGPLPWVELRGAAREMRLVIAVPQPMEAAVRGQLEAWFPGARLEPDLEPVGEHPPSYAVPVALERPPLFPILVPAEGEPDPQLGLVGALTRDGGACGVRLRWGPPPAEWEAWAPAALEAAKAGQPLPPRGWRFLLMSIAAGLRRYAGSGEAAGPPVSAAPDLKGAAAKVRDAAFSVRLTVWAEAPSAEEAEARARDLAAHLSLGLRHPLGNTLRPTDAPQFPSDKNGPEDMNAPELVFSSAELASLFHVPAGEHPLVGRDASRIVAPPPELLSPPEHGSGTVILGEALFPDRAVPFGLGTAERRQHLYVVGKTGTGKSTLLASLAAQDLAAGRGVGLIDPHGDLAERVLALVPPERWEETLYFNPADTEFPIGYNPLHCPDPGRRPLVASGVVGVLKKLYGDSWGPRLEHFLRNAVLALLETPSPSLLLLPRLLTDRDFRARRLAWVRDPVVRGFFRDEFERLDPRFRMEAISPILNKVGQFLSSPVVRNIVGQSGPGFDLRRLMDEGGVLIANLASGRIGEDNAALLGGLLVAGFQLAAMSRADRSEEDRRDFYLVADEFQHFANDAFASILSEARKYRLSLTLAHQYLDQVPPGVLDAVLGNAASLAAFRIGQGDTVRLVRELAPAFNSEDLVHLPDFRFCARVVRQGGTLPAFSARTVPLPPSSGDIIPPVELSRARWGRPRAEVETEIAELWEGRAQ